jgi:hypothetical protein
VNIGLEESEHRVADRAVVAEGSETRTKGLLTAGNVSATGCYCCTGRARSSVILQRDGCDYRRFSRILEGVFERLVGVLEASSLSFEVFLRFAMAPFPVHPTSHAAIADALV